MGLTGISAWEAIKTLPDEALGPEPYLKISGVAIALAQVLEADNKPLEAYRIYAEALQLARPSLKEGIAEFYDISPESLKAQKTALGLRERKRTVAISLNSEKWQNNTLFLPKTKENGWLMQYQRSYE